MKSFKVIKRMLPEGTYVGEISDVKVKDGRIFFDIYFVDEDITFQPSGISLELSEHNPLYLFFKECGYKDCEISDVDLEDLVGCYAHFTIKHRKGNTVTFCNITKMVPMGEDEPFEGCGLNLGSDDLAS